MKNLDSVCIQCLCCLFDLSVLSCSIVFICSTCFLTWRRVDSPLTERRSYRTSSWPYSQRWARSHSWTVRYLSFLFEMLVKWLVYIIFLLSDLQDIILYMKCSWYVHDFNNLWLSIVTEATSGELHALCPRPWPLSRIWPEACHGQLFWGTARYWHSSDARADTCTNFQ